MENGLVRRMSHLGQEFSFELCRKRDQSLGSVTVDHWWMPVTPLYGQRQSGTPPHRNHREILQFYWSDVQGHQATTQREAQERFLLASIVPRVRAEGSRTIFADAFLRPQRRQRQAEEVRELNAILAGGASDRLSRSQFETQTRQILGRVEFPAETQSIYGDLSTQLFDEPCQLLSQGDTDAAIEKVQQSWGHLMRSIGRRSGNEIQKIVLDALSYEARAAFHHLYSVAWLGIIYLLEQGDGIDATTSRFLRFWHLVDADHERATSLFQSHVFALHPATGLFVLTLQGRSLLGDWLTNPGSEVAFERLLFGLYVAMYHYAERRLHASENRPHSFERSTPDLEIIEEIQEERRRGRRSDRRRE